MKSIFLAAALAVSLGLPAYAQDWPLTIPYNPGSTSVQPPATPGTVVNYERRCSNFSGPGGYTVGLCPPGVPWYIHDTVTETTRTAVGAIPAAAASQLYLSAATYFPDASSEAGFSYFSGQIPLSAFATAEQGRDLQVRIDAMASQQSEMTKNRALAFRGIALASSLSMANPLDGHSNRVGLGLGSFANETAMSINYTHRTERFDFGVAAAVAHGDGLGKASVGFSW